jgi:hypothetical protein
MIVSLVVGKCLEIGIYFADAYGHPPTGFMALRFLFRKA